MRGVFLYLPVFFILSGAVIGRSMSLCDLSPLFMRCDCRTGEEGLTVTCNKPPAVKRRNFISVQVNHMLVEKLMNSSITYNVNIWPKLYTIRDHKKVLFCNSSVGICSTTWSKTDINFPIRTTTGKNIGVITFPGKESTQEQSTSPTPIRTKPNEESEITWTTTPGSILSKQTWFNNVEWDNKATQTWLNVNSTNLDETGSHWINFTMVKPMELTALMDKKTKLFIGLMISISVNICLIITITVIVCYFQKLQHGLCAGVCTCPGYQLPSNRSNSIEMEEIDN